MKTNKIVVDSKLRNQKNAAKNMAVKKGKKKKGNFNKDINRTLIFDDGKEITDYVYDEI
jgi:hypothetical protein